MKITRVEFNDFKSLKNIGCDLDDFTIFTGPNGSGKSNFVDGLSFIGAVYSEGLESAVSRAGGFENIAYRRSRRSKNPLRFYIEAEINEEDFPPMPEVKRIFDQKSKSNNFKLIYKHEFSIKAMTNELRSDFEVQSDLIKIFSSKETELFRLEKTDKGYKSKFSSSKSIESQIVKNSLNIFRNQIFLDFIKSRSKSAIFLASEQLAYTNLALIVSKGLSGLKVFQLSPHLARTAGVYTPNARLEKTGENLPGAAEYLYKNAEKSWRKVESAMRAIIPNLQEIRIVFTEDRKLALQFIENNVAKPWTSSEVSDGTIQALAMFVSLYDNRNRILVIEEPENAIHPWILKKLIQACIDVENRQIILTTHSPVVLNYIDPKVLRFFSIRNGQSNLTSFTSLKPSQQELILSGEVSAFDFYDSGIIPTFLPPLFAPET